MGAIPAFVPFTFSNPMLRERPLRLRATVRLPGCGDCADKPCSGSMIRPLTWSGFSTAIAPKLLVFCSCLKRRFQTDMICRNFSLIFRLASLSLVFLLAAAAVLPLSAQQDFPSVAFVTPTTATAGAQDLTIVFTGSGFATGVRVFWETTPLQTNVLSTNQLAATVPAELLAEPGTFQLSVDFPGRGRFNAVSFTVLPGSLAITTTSLPAGLCWAWARAARR